MAHQSYGDDVTRQAIARQRREREADMQRLGVGGGGLLDATHTQEGPR